MNKKCQKNVTTGQAEGRFHRAHRGPGDQSQGPVLCSSMSALTGSGKLLGWS
jgi:hypothetical protein